MSAKNDLIDVIVNQYKNEIESFWFKPFYVNAEMNGKIFQAINLLFGITNQSSIKKGLCITSPLYGQGKTLFFDACNYRKRRRTGQYMFKSMSSKDIVDMYRNTDKDHSPKGSLSKIFQNKHLFIDDLGEEGGAGYDSKVFNHYGNKMNVLEYVILKRYDQWRKHGHVTHFTTNLSETEILDSYGPRAADRLKHMCSHVDFSFLKKGESFRHVKKEVSMDESYRQRAIRKSDHDREIALNNKRKLVKHSSPEELLAECINEYKKNKSISQISFMNPFLYKHILEQDDFNLTDASEEWMSAAIIAEKSRRRSASNEEIKDVVRQKHIYNQMIEYVKLKSK